MKPVLILPVAGASTRFPDVRPKYMLVHPMGNIMLFQGISGLDLDKFREIHITMLKEHVDDYDAYNGVMRASEKLNIRNKIRITVLDEHTKDQPETVIETITRNNITGPIFVKDSDNYFKTNADSGNIVCVYNIESLEMINAGNKSYATVDNGVVTNIAEKRVISPLSCCGGYGFADAAKLIEYYNKCREDYPGNLYLSHIIYRMMLDNIQFEAKEAEDYIDWGTMPDWMRYREQFGTIFVDLDGVLVENSGEYFEPLWGETGPLAYNVIRINNLYDSDKFHIIITTSRSLDSRETTIEQLNSLGIRYHRILFDLPHARRYLINDYAPSNPYPSSVAINISRDSSIRGMVPEFDGVVPHASISKIHQSSGKKRIAVCISGLARTFDKTIANFRQHVLDADNCEFDIFISTWDQVDSKKSTEVAVRDRKALDGELSEVDLRVYSPALIEVESLFEWPRETIEKYKIKRSDTYVPSTLFMLYKIWCADLARQRFEKIHNFKYDLVVRTRFDLRMTERMKYDLGNFDILIPKMRTPTCTEFNRTWVNDTFAVGTSDSMKIYSDIYQNIDKLYDSGVPFQPEIMLNTWLHWNGLKMGEPNAYPLIVRPNGEVSSRPK